MTRESRTPTSIRDLARALRVGHTSAAELTRQALESRRLGAFCAVDEAKSLRQAEAADAAFRAGLDLGPLQGLPISVKDLFGVPGYRTGAGSPAALPPRWESAGPVLTTLLSQLAVIMGKTHTVEFAFGGLGTNPHHPTPVNPWDQRDHRAPGGSTAGGGVSLCEGSSVLALGTDTAGSVRIPASWTGNVAVKTTKGRWSTEGIVPLSSTLDTPGLLARTMDDLVLTFQSLDSRLNQGPQVQSGLEGVDVYQLRLGRCDRLLFETCSPGVVDAVETALDELAKAGASIVSVDIPEVEPVFELFKKGGPVSAELCHFLTTELPDSFETLDPNVQSRIGAAGTMPVLEYLDRLERMRQLSNSASARVSEVDAIVCPTVAITPPRLCDIDSSEKYGPQNLLSLRNTSIVSYLGFCAVTLPVGRDACGMPVGMQLIGQAFDEPAILARARACEDVLGQNVERIGLPPGISIK